MAHSYERIREVVIDAIENTREGQFSSLKEVVAATLAEQSGDASTQRIYILSGPILSYEDCACSRRCFGTCFEKG
jgi:hypothetical protein